MEGALKLKEISYIHAEAYAAGELKHGPLALVDEDMPVVAVAPNNNLLEKLKSNLEEVKARGGKLYIFVDEISEVESGNGMFVLNINNVYDYMAPILHAIPLQLLAYYVAVIKGADIDQPRNLAKSVTLVQFGLEGKGVAPAGVDVQNTGHHHLLINVDEIDYSSPIPSTSQHLHFGLGQTETNLDLPPGKHKLQLILGDKHHVPHQPPLASKIIKITVEE
jgi:hypothetical protein